MSKSTGIVFGAADVRAILDGRKTQTRRVVNMRDVSFIGGADERDDPSAWGWFMDDGIGRWAVLARDKADVYSHGHVSIPCPFGSPGDRLWVREEWRLIEQADGLDGVLYGADHAFVALANDREAADKWTDAYDCGRHGHRWRPSMFLPKWASRISLVVTGVRVERLRSITDADARAEGVSDGGCLSCGKVQGQTGCGCPSPSPSLRDAYAAAWQAKHDHEEWHSNPWVWVIEFGQVAVRRELS